jgi:hypothetical protein
MPKANANEAVITGSRDSLFCVPYTVQYSRSTENPHVDESNLNISIVNASYSVDSGENQTHYWFCLDGSDTKYKYLQYPNLRYLGLPVSAISHPVPSNSHSLPDTSALA